MVLKTWLCSELPAQRAAGRARRCACQANAMLETCCVPARPEVFLPGIVASFSWRDAPLLLQSSPLVDRLLVRQRALSARDASCDGEGAKAKGFVCSCGAGVGFPRLC